MKIALELIIDRLQRYKPVLILCRDENATLLGIKLISGRQDAFYPDFLYMGRASQLTGIPSGQLTNILCIKDMELCEEVMANPNLNLILLDERYDLVEVINQVQDVVTCYQQWIFKLYQALEKDNTLQAILDIGCEILDNPIYLVDIGLKFLAMAKADMITNVESRKSLMQGYLSPQIIQSLRTDKSFKKISESMVPVYGILGADPGNTTPVAICNIRVAGKVLAQVIVAEELRPITKGDMSLLIQLRDVISLKMGKNDFMHTSKGLIHEFIIADLLNNQVKDPVFIQERLKYIDWHPKENLYAISISIDPENIANTPLQYIRDKAESMLPLSIATVYNDNVVMIVSRSRYAELTKDELSALQGFLLQYNLKCGISICFHDLVKMSNYYNQALKAVLFGTMMDSTQVLYWYEDYAVFHVVDAASQCGNLLNFFHPALLKLLDHDQKSHTNYASSLKAYLESERNIVLSASILHIHRNTMVYRIGKIEEITGIDFQDSSLRLHFLMSFKMLDYMKISGKTIQVT